VELTKYIGFVLYCVLSVVEQVVAMFTYQKQNADELDFIKGSIINVLNKLDADWWMGELNGTTGLFPSNYVAPLSATTSSEYTY